MQIFLDQNGNKYASEEKRHPADCLLPHTSPALVELLTDAPPMSSVNIDAIMEHQRNNDQFIAELKRLTSPRTDVAVQE